MKKIILILLITLLSLNASFAECTYTATGDVISCDNQPAPGDFSQVPADNGGSGNSPSSGGGGNIQYEMTAYVPNNRDANTPFLNMSFLNQRYFTINYQSFGNGFQFLFDLVIGISIATAVIVFMIAAFKKITNSTSVKDIQAGDQGMINAIVGLMIVLSTWLIINTINPDLIRLPIFTSLDSLGQQTQQQSSQAPLENESF